MFFPNNTLVRQHANYALKAMGLCDGAACIKENKKSYNLNNKLIAFNVYHKHIGAKKGRHVFSVILWFSS